MPFDINGNWVPNQTPQQQNQNAMNQGQPMTQNQYTTQANNPSYQQQQQMNTLQNKSNVSNQLGNSNNYMNQPGQQGAVAQAGFQGFQVNGNSMPQTQYTQAQNPYQMQAQYNQGNSNQLGNQSYTSNNNYNPNVAQSNQGNYGQIQNQYSNPMGNIGAYQAGYTNTNIDGSGTSGYPLPAMAYSDKNLKTDINVGDKAIQDFLNSIKPYSYEYKDEKHGVGRRISPMAQDFEKTPLGKVMVSETPDGKQVDYGKGIGTIFASLALLNHKYNGFEKMITKKISEALKKNGK